MDDLKRRNHNAYMREWKKLNREKVNAINRAVKAKDPERYRAINRESVARARAADPERFRAYHHRRREDQPLRYLVDHARKRAAVRGVPFDLVESDIVIPEFCPVLGIKLEWGFGQRASANAASPSLDRVVPAKGYVKGNVKVISNRANNLKNNATLEELRALVAYVERETA